MFDCIIRNGLIQDGRGGEPFIGDIAISEGRIAEIGAVSGEAREELDAGGFMVTPGWVDIHTHYDGQATWDQRVQPSSMLGTTTAVMGNCGVGFAPVREMDHNRLIRLMEGVEDIPGVALHAGLSWNWESFPDYLDTLDEMPRDIDIAAQVPHSALRVYVMGERGARHEAATADEIALMGELTKDAIAAGALGFSTSRVIFHRTADGDLAPSVGAARNELVGIAQCLKENGQGVLQIASDFYNNDQEFGILMEMARVSGRPLSFSYVETDDRLDFWDQVVERLDQAARAGLKMKAQVQGRSVGLLLTLEGSVHPFITRPSYIAISDMPIAERLKIMRDPEFRDRLLSEEPAMGHPFVNQVARSWNKMFELGDPPEYEPTPDKSIGARAAALGVDPQNIVYDILTGGEGLDYLYFPMANFCGGNYDSLKKILNHPGTVPGLSDGGAHVGVICDASVATYMLTHWCRDRREGERLHLPEVIKRQTKDAAETVGLLDRGVLAPGYRADLNVIDFARLQLKPPRLVYDLPAQARRLMQDADGYVATMVKGEIIYRDGKATGALPGRLVRGSQPPPL